MTDALKKKVDFAIKLLQNAEKMAANVNQPVEICYSGGKDSDVILELARMSGINYRAIYKNTTIDPPGTIKHALDNECEVMRPKRPFFNLIKTNGLPTRHARFCCKYLKEYKVLDYAVIGVRREESHARAERYKEPEECRVYSKTSKARHYLPLLDWTSKDVADFIAERGIKCHSLYYDEQGTFHPERRLGCMACPLKNRRQRLEDLQRYPNLAKQYIKAAKVYYDTRFRNRSRQGSKLFDNAYEWFTMMTFCDSMIDFYDKFGGNIFEPPINCKQFLEEYFDIKL